MVCEIVPHPAQGGREYSRPAPRRRHQGEMLR